MEERVVLMVAQFVVAFTVGFVVVYWATKAR
jgi:nitrogen fixation-related uncharacterized protein